MKLLIIIIIGSFTSLYSGEIVKSMFKYDLMPFDSIKNAKLVQKGKFKQYFVQDTLDFCGEKSNYINIYGSEEPFAVEISLPRNNFTIHCMNQFADKYNLNWITILNDGPDKIYEMLIPKENRKIGAFYDNNVIYFKIEKLEK